VSDFEAVEFARGWAYVAALVADVVGKALADFPEEGVGFAAFAFGDELDAAVGQVADVAGNLVAAGDRVGCVAEADALDVAFVIHGAAMGGHCHSERSEESARPRWRSFGRQLSVDGQLMGGMLSRRSGLSMPTPRGRRHGTHHLSSDRALRLRQDDGSA
jgi:hypothetical protein